ncbi:pyridoxal phosphate-dependent transferase [Dactylonectria estremocensis]|uniref:Pyridoxal phosphate-dependent transferase n=1 Tax=Dactylonectria estremocensis TaxID=1079267 RepID=A0A9P9JIP5_9HYPO|nr:pyridoxal phosphate-dependent transferase [Dactylonectria estremocensis]
MVILKTQSEFGHAPPPQTPNSIITNIPTWKVAQAFRDGDPTPLAKIVHLYPRFLPMQFAAKLGQAIVEHLGFPEKRALIYLNPELWPYTQRHVTLEGRGPHRMSADDVALKVVDIAGHRVYAVVYEPQNTFGVILTWGAPGLGISIRGGEELLRGVDTIKEVVFKGNDDLPAPTWTPESAAHKGLRERIIELLRRSPINPDNIQSTPSDVYLYPSGMGAIYHTTNLLMEYRPGTIVVLGIVFHNTQHHLHEESPHGFKHVGTVDEAAIDGFENWLETEKQVSRPVSYAIVEIPGNPTLESPDLVRLRSLSDRYGFPLIIDDTVAGFGNVDVLALSDMLLTSLTKSFSGQADVMGGSVVLNPLSPHYASLSPRFKAKHRNELFASDAAVLLSNSRDFLERTAILNRNAAAMARFLHEAKALPGSPVADVRYPALLPSRPAYDAVMRPGAPELPDPGYGCLLTVDFDRLETAVAFYDRCGFYPSPHLGGHVTLVFAYNMAVFGKKPEERAHVRELGVKEEGVRISAGLESEEDLIDTLRDALDAAIEVKKDLAAREE